MTNFSRWTIVRTESSDRLQQIVFFATHGWNEKMRFFLKMRSLDQCKSAARSREVDFLLGNERYRYAELICTKTCAKNCSDIACYVFATKWWFLCQNLKKKQKAEEDGRELSILILHLKTKYSVLLTYACEIMSQVEFSPRSAEEVFQNFKGRQAGINKALNEDVVSVIKYA